MKIGYVLDDSLDKTDGVQQYVVTLGKWFKSRGHEIHYLVGQTERRDLPHIHSLSRNVQVHFNQNRLSTPLPAESTAIKGLLQREQFDVLHVQLPYSPFLAGRIIKHASRQTAIFGTFHIVPFSSLERAGTTLLGLLLRRNLKRFHGVYSVSEPAAEFARASLGLKTAVLPNAVDVTTFHSARPFKKYLDGTVNVVFLGRLVERKGCVHLLRAIERLHDQRKLDGVRVLICGKGPLDSSLKQFVAEHHLKKVVTFLGYVSEDDKARYFKTAHIAVFPSTGGESFGIVLIEAMAAGSAAILAGDNVGYKSVLGGKADQLVHPSDIDSFASKLHHFIANARARNAALKWQTAEVDRYDVRNIGNTLEEAYKAALHSAHDMR